MFYHRERQEKHVVFQYLVVLQHRNIRHFKMITLISKKPSQTVIFQNIHQHRHMYRLQKKG